MFIINCMLLYSPLTGYYMFDAHYVHLARLPLVEPILPSKVMAYFILLGLMIFAFEKIINYLILLREFD